MLGRLYAQSDSSVVFSYDDFIEIVKNHHPMAIQAEIQLEKGEAEIRKARGGFDPKIMASASEKDFQDKDYYEMFDGGLKIPTWYGLELNGGYEQNRGLFLNPENNVPGAGLVYAGVGLTIGKGLFIDERRAELRKAQIFNESSDAMRRSMYNELVYDASKSYWDWYMAFNVLQIYRNALLVAQQRFDAVKRSAFLGDIASIDTLEAGIQVQNRQLSLQQSELDFANSGALLAVYLWIDGEIPLEISENLFPDTLQLLNNNNLRSIDETLVDSLIEAHPDLQQYAYKIETLDIDRRWKQEQLKPQIDLKYNFLTEAIDNEFYSGFTPNNYKWGVQFSMPILLRKERGGLLVTKLKIQEANFDQSMKRAEITYKVTSARNEFQTTGDQIDLYQNTVRDYSGLLKGERQKFEGGESYLFLVNFRELAYINAQIKLLELITKNQKSRLKYDYSLGILGL
jgi:outer membrane protein TolC